MNGIVVLKNLFPVYMQKMLFLCNPFALSYIKRRHIKKEWYLDILYSFPAKIFLVSGVFSLVWHTLFWIINEAQQRKWFFFPQYINYSSENGFDLSITQRKKILNSKGKKWFYSCQSLLSWSTRPWPLPRCAHRRSFYPKKTLAAKQKLIIHLWRQSYISFSLNITIIFYS